jgi:hypothetical protein
MILDIIQEMIAIRIDLSGEEKNGVGDNDFSF